jgi:hypothetical protein
LLWIKRLGGHVTSAEKVERIARDRGLGHPNTRLGCIASSKERDRRNTKRSIKKWCETTDNREFVDH